ncbi:hypothetical protein DFQ29_003110 [Apophysomyces sp. BC1021]|nr:hypothetical protein DFQ29_003110 [Apophysomyces sp. BC1021]
MESTGSHRECVTLFRMARSTREDNTSQSSNSQQQTSSKNASIDSGTKFTRRESRGAHDIISMDDISPQGIFQNSASPKRETSTVVGGAAPAWTALNMQRSNVTFDGRKTRQPAKTSQRREDSTHPSDMPIDQSSRRQRDTVKDDEFIKFASPSAKFDDLREEAINLWTSGVDLQLPKQGKNKAKKTTWMTDTEFEEILGDTAPKNTTEEAFIAPSVPSTNRGTEGLSYAKATAQNLPQWVSGTPKTSTADSRNMTQTISTVFPSAYLGQQESHVQQPMIWQTSVGSQLIGSAFPSGSVTSVDPRFANMYGFYSAAPPYQSMTIAQAPQSQLATVSVEEDIKAFRFLDSVTRNFFGKQTLQRFQKHLDHLLKQAPHLSHRTFKKLINAINFAMVQEQGHSQMLEKNSRLGTILQSNIPVFLSVIYIYVQTYVQTPKELASLLELFLKLTAIDPESANHISFQALELRFGQIENNFLPEESQNIRELFDRISIVRRTRETKDFWPENNIDVYNDSSESQDIDWVDAWKDTFNALPSLPKGADIVREANLNNGVGMEKFSKSSIADNLKDSILLPEKFTNIVSTPWPHNSLKVYLMIHYMLLREEVCGPIRYAFENHVKKGPGNNSVLEQWTTYSGLRVCGTTLTMTLMEPAIVFSFKDQSHTPSLDNPCLSEGSMVMLVPEDINLSRKKFPHVPNNLGEFITGIIVHSVSSNENDSSDPIISRMIAIHVNQQDIGNLRWSSAYTLLATCVDGASILPTLSWLRQECSEFKEKNFSLSLVPRILSASNQIDQHESQPEIEIRERDEQTLPDYLLGRELDIACIMSSSQRGHRATAGGNNWPRLPSKFMSLSPSQRPPLYKLSTSQVKAVRHALSHRVSVISGAAGTGKTFLAGKLVQLTHQALVLGQCFQPVLLLTRTEATLDNILGSVVGNIPDLIRLGSHEVEETLVDKQAVNLIKPSVNDPNRRQIQYAEKNIADVEKGDSTIMCTAIPPKYMAAIRAGSPSSVTAEDAWKYWIGDEDSREEAKGASVWKLSSARRLAIYQELLSTMHSHTGHKILPIMDQNTFQHRKDWINQHQPRINNIANAATWPLPNSQNASEIRRKLVDTWSQIPPDTLWATTAEIRERICQQAVTVLLTYIDKDIDFLLKEQFEAAKVLEDARVQKWTSMCRFSRLIGMTADFAAANRNIIASLRPRVVIVDEASGIFESTIASSALGPRTEHLILLGDGCTDDKPIIVNKPLKGAPRHLDVSLFERWKMAGGEVVTLDEQWRMCTDLADVQDALGNVPGKQRLLITKPLSSRSSSLVDRDAPVLKGVQNRLFFVDYQGNSPSRATDHYWSHLMNCIMAKEEIDEARYVCHLALYLYQQGYKPGKIAILTLSRLQKLLIQKVMEDEIPKRTCFFGNMSSITVDLVNDRVGQENWNVVLSLAMPCGEKIPDDNLALALSRARYGLYIVAKPGQLAETRWGNLVEYTKNKGKSTSSRTIV